MIERRNRYRLPEVHVYGCEKPVRVVLVRGEDGWQAEMRQRWARHKVTVCFAELVELGMSMADKSGEYPPEQGDDAGQLQLVGVLP